MLSRRLCVVLLVLCYNVGAENGDENVPKKYFTANDLIQQLTKLAIADSIPRLRFPVNNNGDFEENSGSQRIQPNFQSNLQNQNYIRDSFPPNGNPAFQNIGPETGQYDQYPNQPPFPRPPRRRRPKKQKRPNGYYQQYPQNQYPQDYPPDSPYPQEYPPQRPYYPEYPPPDGYPQQDPYLQGGYPPGYPQQDPYLQGGYPPGYPLQDPYLQGGAPPGYPPQDPYLQGQFPYGQEGPLSSLTRALNSIAKYDDQQCVPRLLCEVAAGGNPSSKQTSFLPSFLNNNMESLFTLLSAFTGDEVSPYLVFGRAALLGVTSQGRPSSCRYAYPECPRDPDRLVEYLNNHNGGFFRFFNGLRDPLNPNQNLDLQQQDNSQFGPNQLAQLFGQGFNRPGRPNQSGVYNQRPSYDSTFNKGEDGYVGQYPADYQYGRVRFTSNQTNLAESRIQNKPQPAAIFYGLNNINSPVANNDLYISQSFHNFDYSGSQNEQEPNSAFKFPNQFNNNNINYIPNSSDDKNTLKFPSDGAVSNNVDTNRKRPKALLFPGATDITQNQNLYYPKPLPFYDYSKMIFPDRTGTGNLKFDSAVLSDSNYRPDIYRTERPASYAQSGIRDSKYYSNDQYQAASSKKYVYIVRGNGDPNHPEIVEDKYVKQRSVNHDDGSVPEYRRNARSGRAWAFPSTYQGVIYNDRSFDTRN